MKMSCILENSVYFLADSVLEALVGKLLMETSQFLCLPNYILALAVYVRNDSCFFSFN